MKRLVRANLLILLVVMVISGCAAGDSPTAATPTREAPTPLATLAPAATTTRSPERADAPAVDVVDTPTTDELAFPENLPQVTLDVELMYSERWMRVEQQVALTNDSGRVWDEVVFNAPIRSVPDAFFFDAVQVEVNGEPQESIPPNTSPRNVVRMPLIANPGDEIVIEMEYRVVVPPVDPTSWPPTGTTGWRFELLQAGEFYPALVPYIDGEWQAVEYHPVGDPTFYALTDTRLNVTTSEDVTIVSGGFIEQEGDTRRFAVKGARGVAFFASPFYQRSTRSTGEAEGVTVESYYLAEHATGGEAALQAAIDSILLFEALIGPYPYDSLTVVENGFFGGMEYSALISITDYAYLTYQGNANSILHALTAHEVAHQWWYGAVGNNQAEEAWLDESLGFYGEYLYYENLHPEHTEWWWEARVLQFDLYGPVDATIYSYNESSEFILSMYGQAALFINRLRGMMGDEAFFAFLQDYYATHYGQVVTGEDFFDAVRRHTDADLEQLKADFFANPDL